jgi:ABC-type dipeptide/oligopeptide/nickel transport system permease component
MTEFIIRRTLAMLVVMFVISLVTFMILRAVPGGPFDRERELPEEVIANINARYHLDDPVFKQYADYLYEVAVPHITGEDFRLTVDTDFLINLDLPGDQTLRWMNFGPSFIARGRSVTDVLRDNFPVTAQLGIYSLAIALSIGMPAGIFAALNRNTIYDYAGMSIAILGVSVPVIIMGPILQYVLGVRFNLLPISGWGSWKQIIMPAFALGFSQSALIARLTRASLLQVLHEDYIRTARAKGLQDRSVIGKHAMKNALIPVITVLGPLTAYLLTGSFVTELIFAIPGVGREFVRSIGNRDYPLVMGTVLLYAFILVAANALVDITYALLDPRIRYD